MDTSLLSIMEAKLPPGFRFHPRDEELINDYLAKRASGEQSNGYPMMVDVDLNKVEPWELPAEACVGKEWYFYSQRDKKYATGQRTNRATLSGYWKATGKDRQVADGRKGGRLVGMRKTLVFYQGRAPKGKKTDWVMHEFRMEAAAGDQPKPPPASSSYSTAKEDWVLSRVFYKSRLGPSAKPTTMENCYDDTGSSSIPPLTNAYINFDGNNNNNSSSSNIINNNNLHGFSEQVPCFSNLRQYTAFGHPPPPLLPPPLVDTSLLPNKSLTPASAPQLRAPGPVPDMVAPYMNRPTSFSGEKMALKAVLDHISNADGGPPTGTAGGALPESSPPSFGPHSMWNPF